MDGFSRHQDYRIGRALLLATLLVVLGGWLFPVGWLRIFGREVHDVPDPEPTGERWVRLIPAESLEDRERSSKVPIRISLEPQLHPDTDHEPERERHAWTVDPTTAFRPLEGTAEPLAPVMPDSIRLRADFLHALRLGNMDAVFAMLDTTQAGRAREQMAETDEWVHRNLAPWWTAEGRARRMSDLYWRVINEAEAEGSH